MIGIATNRWLPRWSAGHRRCCYRSDCHRSSPSVGSREALLIATHEALLVITRECCSLPVCHRLRVLLAALLQSGCCSLLPICSRELLLVVAGLLPELLCSTMFCKSGREIMEGKGGRERNNRGILKILKR